MGRQIVNPITTLDRLAVVESLVRRLSAAIGDWRKHGEETEKLLALALVIVLGPRTLRAVFQTINELDNGGPVLK